MRNNVYIGRLRNSQLHNSATDGLLARTRLPDAVEQMLWRDYDTQVSVDFPSPKTGDRWRLTAQGWVGHIPLTPDFHIALHPKVKLGNLLRMLEYTYQLKNFPFGIWNFLSAACP